MTEKPGFSKKLGFFARFIRTCHVAIGDRAAYPSFANRENHLEVTAVISKNDFPNLFGETSWGTVTCRFECLNEMPPLNLISNVNLVPFRGDRWLVLRLQTGEWEVPGGTLEPGESYSDAISRELMEEAGARLISFEPLGAWHCFSTAPKPYRVHLPHPEFYRLAGYGAVEIISSPENPEGGEQVASVDFVPIEEAVQRFQDINRFELAELYQLAAKIREIKNKNR